MGRRRGGGAVRVLCQRGGATCGACCGLYNRADASREAAREDLRENTLALRGLPRTPEAFRAAAARRARELPAPLFPTVRTCPLLGFLDAGGERIGCLAHPSMTGGVDLRACGAYDALTCDAFLCPSHAHIREDEAELAARAAGDFYRYGLLVTDVPFLRAALGALGARSGVAVRPAHLDHPPFLRALSELLGLKEELAPGAEGYYGAFQRRPPPAAQEAGGTPEGAILDHLGGDAGELEGEVAHRLAAAAAALRAAEAQQRAR
jgi:hypothetical protein